MFILFYSVFTLGQYQNILTLTLKDPKMSLNSLKYSHM